MKNEQLTSRDLAQQRTRETLLATAAQLVAEKGLGAVSIGDIAGAAGFTKGAFYSNFDSREAMLLELVGLRQCTAMKGPEALDTPADLSRALDQLLEIALNHAESPTALLIGEIQLLVRRNPGFAGGLEAEFKERVDVLAGWIDQILHDSGTQPTLSSTELARLFMGLSQGLAQQPADRGAAKGMLRLVFGHIFAGRKG